MVWRLVPVAGVLGLLLGLAGCQQPFSVTSRDVEDDPFLSAHHDVEPFPCGQATVAEVGDEPVVEHEVSFGEAPLPPSADEEELAEFLKDL